MISIIILNYNGRDFLEGCLDSVLGQTFNDFEIIFVDNNSTDDSINFIKSNFSDNRIKIVVSEKNLGFAGGNNLGLKNTSGEYIVLLNNDTVVDKDWLKYLYELINSDETIGIAQSLVITEGIPSKYYEKNGTVNILGHNIMEIFDIGEDGIGEIFQATGCSLIIRKNLSHEIEGLFLDEYFAYAEDTFLCFKVKFFGKRIMHTSKSLVHHKGNATFKKQKSTSLYFFQERNRLLNFLLFFSKPFLIKYIPYLIFNFFIKLFASLFEKKYSAIGLIRAYFWLTTHYKWIKEQRHKLNKLKTVDDNEVLKFLSGKIFNGDNFLERVINYFSLVYCKLTRIFVIENVKTQ
ncbi:MAG: glycosyltransferase family 2 protein [Ignavibacteria bacterium]|nr:glycosyltransferase family 2 protein [Ignavibacteria bacterium]